jgi:LPS export ABC transporter protein LptC
MVGPRHANRKRWLTLLTLCLILTILTGLLLYKSGSDESGPVEEEVLPLEADLTISKVHQTATRDGIKEWHLDAESAKFYNKNRELILNSISMVFFLENDRIINLSADKGILATESKDVVVEGNIIVTGEQARLETSRLYYSHNKRMLYGDEPVRITGEAFYLKADGVSYDLNTNRTVFEGNVEGFLSEDLSM